MQKREPNGARVVYCLLAAISLLGLWGAGELLADGPYCRITGLRPARVFYPGERVVLSVQAPGDNTVGHYTVTNYYDEQVRSGDILVGSDVPQRLDLRAGYPFGIYYLHFDFDNGKQQDDAFCLLPRPDAGLGDYGVFSWHFHSLNGDEWCALAQVGCRLIRTDMAWPDVEPQAGQINLSRAENLAALARQYGAQLIPILGYSPRWIGMHPYNASGRPDTAWHTWPPETTPPWQDYVRTVVNYLGNQQITWPSAAALRPQAVGAQNSLPLVHSWEIWNEVDQNFYYGYWGRYVDLLRIAYGEIKQHNPWATVLYGGSCGHWTELGLTYSMGGQFFFDRLAFHPGGDNIDAAFAMYFCGAPQIGNGYGIYHPATMTESYPYCPPGLTDSEYMLRLYALLRKWQIDTFCTFDGGRVVGTPDPASISLLWRQGDELVPNAKYVSLAMTRWLLCEAVYVGPLDLGSGVHTYLFLRGGRPLLVCWADQQTQVSLRAIPGACLIDEMGQRDPLPVSGDQAEFTLGPAARAVVGANRDYIAEAIRNQAELILRTPQGFETDRAFGYIGPLEADAAWAWADWPQHIRELLDHAEEEIKLRPRYGGRALDLVQAEINAQVCRTLRQFIAQGGGCRLHSIIWRLQSFSEWLGKAIDSYDQRWPGATISPATVGRLQQQVEALQSFVVSEKRGLAFPLAVQSLHRSHACLQQLPSQPGVGRYRAAKGEYGAAVLLSRLENRAMTGIVAAADFTTAIQLVKALALVPGQEHELRSYVYNFTTQDVSGTLHWEVPPEWTSEPISARFTAPAGGCSDPIICTVPIPGGSGDWVIKEGWSPGGPVRLRLPEELDEMAVPTLSAELDNGHHLISTGYLVLVGEPVVEP